MKLLWSQRKKGGRAWIGKDPVALGREFGRVPEQCTRLRGLQAIRAVPGWTSYRVLYCILEIAGLLVMSEELK